jgi:esterase/lipase superfamily enzyme
VLLLVAGCGGDAGAPGKGAIPRGDPPAAGGPETPAATEPHPVEVFYVTDRARLEPTSLWYGSRFLWALLAFLLGRRLVRWVRRVIRPEYPGIVRTVRALAWVAPLGLLVHGGWTSLQTAQHHARARTVYGGERALRTAGDLAPLELGRCTVSVPPVHAIGEIERPSLWKGDWFMDPERHMVVLDVTPAPQDAWFQAVSARVGASGQRDAFVFVHGYNVSFESALLRTAQIAYDLGFEGAPICYSWPSLGRATGYILDAANVGWTVGHLTRFLEALPSRTGARRIHLVAHSMGNRALTEALRYLTTRARDETAPLFNQIVLAAPDLDASTFREYIAPGILGAAERLTLYASRHDAALLASRKVHGSPRAGEAGDHLVIVEGMDTVDVSQVSGSHSYIGDNDWVLDDLRDLLMHDRILISRPGGGVEEVWQGERRFWRLLAR